MATEAQGRRKRNYGTGGLRQIGGSWYGTWRDPDGHKVQRKIGAVRTPGKADGIPKVEAERRLVIMRQETGRVIRLEDRVTIEVAGAEYCRRLAVNKERKTSYKLTQASDIRNHLAPFFGTKTIDKIKPRDIESYIAKKQDTLAIKTISNHVNTLHSIFESRDAAGVVRLKPGEARRPPDRQRLRQGRDRHPLPGPGRLEKLISAPYPDDAWGSIEPTLYLTAAMSGLRQGELIALRWRDVDFDARRIRVVQNYVRGKFDTPKSGESGRSVPMASKVEGHRRCCASRAAPTSP